MGIEGTAEAEVLNEKQRLWLKFTLDNESLSSYLGMIVFGMMAARHRTHIT